MKSCKIIRSSLLYCLFIAGLVTGQEPYRVGTTAANFLEIGVGSAGNAMGDAYVSVANDLSSAYWNPAGLAHIRGNEAMFAYQPWVVDINAMFAGAAVAVPNIGTFAGTMTYYNYGDMKVTTLEAQEGTGEMYSANDMSATLSYARRLVSWFSFGASAKYISSQIWHLKASAFALDLGVIVNTHFFSISGDKADGLKIGMSISNYGSRLKYSGMDILNYIDIEPDESGNYEWVPGQFRLNEWELPLIFRIGVAVKPLVGRFHRLTLAADALHPNNNSESINTGAEYELIIPGRGSFFLRGGYKALFMEKSEYGITWGGGMKLTMLGNNSISIDYAYRSIGILGNTHAYTIGFNF